MSPPQTRVHLPVVPLHLSVDFDALQQRDDDAAVTEAQHGHRDDEDGQEVVEAVQVDAPLLRRQQYHATLCCRIQNK